MGEEAWEDQLERLRAMAKEGQTKWDLSPNDQSAIRAIVAKYDAMTSAPSYPPRPGWKRPFPNAPMPRKLDPVPGRPGVAATDGIDPEYHGRDAPKPVNPETGMHKSYYVLDDEEREKGFVRPLRLSYRHVGVRPKGPTRPLTEEEQELYAGTGYVAFEPYENNETSTGRFWTAEQLDSGCGHTTTMSRTIAETYARNPKFYGKTMCVHCRDHFLVGEHGEFVWEGTQERVGT